jgi:RNA recognition motif-containing protein
MARPSSATNDVRFAKNRKYALVTFYYQASAEAALSSNNLWLNGRTLRAKMGEWTVL